MTNTTTIKQLANALKKKDISSVELVQEKLRRIKLLEPKINSFISLTDEEELLTQAKIADKTRNDKSSLVHGITFSMKDAYVTRSLPTTAASNVLKKYTPPYDATVFTKLNQNGGLLLGKNNQDAWGHGGSTENTDFGPTKNPWNTQHIAGGSSGGSAAAISSGLVDFSIGEDTGGSIRNPSSMCNVSGLKVTYGRVSRYGAIAYASSLDTVGPMARSVEDLAVILELIAGFDPLDATSVNKPVENYLEKIDQPIKGKKIGLPKEYFSAELDKNVRSILDQAIEILRKLGCEVVEVSLPSTGYQIPGYYLIALSETSSNLARYDGIRYGNVRENFTDETIRRIILGTHALSAGYSDELYKKAQKLRTKFIQEYAAAFEKCDVMLAPIVAGEPAKIGELINDPIRNLLEDLYTVTVNLVGVPSLALPAGFSKNNLPIGFQLIGKHFHEAELLNIGHKYQQETDWHKQLPDLAK